MKIEKAEIILRSMNTMQVYHALNHLIEVERIKLSTNHTKEQDEIVLDLRVMSCFFVCFAMDLDIADGNNLKSFSHVSRIVLPPLIEYIEILNSDPETKAVADGLTILASVVHDNGFKPSELDAYLKLYYKQ